MGLNQPNDNLLPNTALIAIQRVFLDHVGFSRFSCSIPCKKRNISVIFYTSENLLPKLFPKPHTSICMKNEFDPVMCSI